MGDRVMADRIQLNEARDIVTQSLSRMDLAKAVGQTAYDGDRDYYAVLGYPTKISPSDYMERYERQNIASRVVDLPATDTWKSPPQVSEDDNSETDFVKQWDILTKRLGVFNALGRVDRLSGIGRFGVLLMGFKGEGEPLDPVEAGSLSGEEDVLFLRPFSEIHTEIKEWVDDTADKRFGLPKVYSIKTQGEEKDAILVHWSRVLHVADNKLDSETYGIPRLRPVFNLLDDLMKITGGTAEATWLSMRPGIMVSPEEGFKWDDTSDAETQFLREMDRYAHDPLRMLRLVGLKATPIAGGQILDPSGPYNVTLSLIAAATGIPQRVLTGSSAGELASAKEDSRTWAQFVANRQKNYAEPEILRVFIDRLVDLGVLPPPSGGNDAYDIGELDPDGGRSWPSIIELSEQERGEAIKSQAGAVKELMDPVNQTLPITLEEQRKLLGYPVEPEDGELPAEGGGLTDVPALETAIKNYQAGTITADQLAQFAIDALKDVGEPGEMAMVDQIVAQMNMEQRSHPKVSTQAKKKGPGRGWWGPPKGSHVEAGGGLSPEARATLKGLGATDMDLRRVAISNKAPPGFKLSKDDQTFISDRTGVRAAGLYQLGRREGVLHLTKNATDNTAMHELGHHVTNRADKFRMSRDINQAIPEMKRDYVATESWAQHSQTGLRDYSYTNGDEFLADAYKVKRMGTADQWENIKTLVEYTTFGTDIDDAFPGG